MKTGEKNIVQVLFPLWVLGLMLILMFEKVKRISAGITQRVRNFRKPGVTI